MAQRFAFLEHDGPLAFAHRGGAAGGLENSMAAFHRAVELGYRYLETDVHATADGVLLAFHDSTLDRVTDRRGRSPQLPWSDGVPGPDRRASSRSRCWRTCSAAWPDIRLNVDVKEAAAVAAPGRAPCSGTGAVDRVCVASFSRRRLHAVRAALGPRLCTSLSAPRGRSGCARPPSTRPRLRLAAPGAPCAQLPDRVGPLRVVTRGLVRLAHARGLQVHVWTVDDPPRCTACSTWASTG